MTSGRLALSAATTASMAARKLSAVATAAISKTLYGTCYYAAYGVTFGALAVASLIPKGGVLEKGFHDGAEAAREAFH
jgi:hypothetical protein